MRVNEKFLDGFLAKVFIDFNVMFDNIWLEPTMRENIIDMCNKGELRQFDYYDYNSRQTAYVRS